MSATRFTRLVRRWLDRAWRGDGSCDTGNDTRLDERDRFDKFTQRARNVLVRAQQEAQRLAHPNIGTEHLLLGLVREDEGMAGQVLKSLGIELDQVRQAVEERIGHGYQVVLGEIGLTPRAKRVLELAVEEARHLHHHYIGTEHLLLGMLREGEGIGAGVLQDFDLSVEQVRAKTLEILHEA